MYFHKTTLVLGKIFRLKGRIYYEQQGKVHRMWDRKRLFFIF